MKKCWVMFIDLLSLDVKSSYENGRKRGNTLARFRSMHHRMQSRNTYLIFIHSKSVYNQHHLTFSPSLVTLLLIIFLSFFFIIFPLPVFISVQILKEFRLIFCLS